MQPPNFDDYPYSESCDSMTAEELDRYAASLKGLNKLRTIRDRRAARMLFDVYLANGWNKHYVFDPTLARAARNVADVFGGGEGGQ